MLLFAALIHPCNWYLVLCARFVCTCSTGFVELKKIMVTYQHYSANTIKVFTVHSPTTIIRSWYWSSRDHVIDLTLISVERHGTHSQCLIGIIIPFSDTLLTFASEKRSLLLYRLPMSRYGQLWRRSSLSSPFSMLLVLLNRRCENAAPK